MPTWTPPRHLLHYIQDLPAERVEALFDPHAAPEDTDGDECEHAEHDEDYEVEAEAEADRERDKDYEVEAEAEAEKGRNENVSAQNRQTERGALDGEERQKRGAAEQLEAAARFEEMLREKSTLNPFQDWATIRTTLAGDARFEGVRSEKARIAIFDRMCPELAERARSMRRQQVAAAEAAWAACLADLRWATAPATWTEFSRTVRKHPWFRHLDGKRMEKEYRAHLASLRDRSIVYQIPK